MDINTFKVKFADIRNRGFIKTHRSGDTGVGHTLEQELGLEENCISGPDLEGYELKAARRGAGGKQSLLTCEGDWVLDQMSYMKKYGKMHKNGVEISGNSTVTPDKNNRDLFIKVDEKKVAVCSSTETIVDWTWEYIEGKFENKFLRMIKVVADTKGSGDDEHYHYKEANVYRLKSKDAFRQAVANGDVIIEFRMRTNDNQTKIRNRGTAFRINHEKLQSLFVEENVI